MKLSQNTRFKKLSPKWIKYRDWYEADHDTLVNNQAYLIPHPIELGSSEDARRLYSGRKNRTEAMKLVEMGVSIWCSILFREVPAFDDEARKLLEEHGADKDIDGEGTSFESFIIEDLSPWFLVYGDIAVLAESFAVSVESRGQEKDLGLRPYLKIISPLSLTDWSKETADPKRLGRLNFARYEYYKENPRMVETEEVKRLLCSDSFRRDSSGRVSIQKYSVELDNNGAPKLKDNEIDWEIGPLIPLDERLKEIPISLIQKETWVDGSCAEAKRHFNHRSNLDSINHFQGYPSDWVFGVDPSDAAQYKLVAEYTHQFVKDPEARVERLQPGDTSGMERAVADALNTFFKVTLDQVRSLPTDSKAVQGADTISEENKNLYTLLLSTIGRLENLCQQALNDFALLSGAKDFKGKITFNREIKEEDINQIIKIFNSFADILKPVDGLNQAMVEKLIPKLKFGRDKTKELIAKIESAEILKPAEQAAKEAELSGKVDPVKAQLGA